MLSHQLQSRSWLVLLLLCGWMVTGCQSTKGPGSESLTSIKIQVNSPFEVARAASHVLHEEGFEAVPLPANKEMKLLFEKEAGTGADLLYGDWGGGKVWYRLKLRISTLNEGTQLLTCDAFRVLDHGDPHFEQEQRLKHAKKSYCQGLLNKIKEQSRSPL